MADINRELIDEFIKAQEALSDIPETFEGRDALKTIMLAYRIPLLRYLEWREYPLGRSTGTSLSVGGMDDVARVVES